VNARRDDRAERRGCSRSCQDDQDADEDVRGRHERHDLVGHPRDAPDAADDHDADQTAITSP
jgi:hypothetical protein